MDKKLLEIKKDNPNYEYRSMAAMLKKLGFVINKNKVQRLIQKLKLKVRNFSKKSRKYYNEDRTKEKLGYLSPVKYRKNIQQENFHT